MLFNSNNTCTAITKDKQEINFPCFDVKDISNLSFITLENLDYLIAAQNEDGELVGWYVKHPPMFY